MSTEPEAALAPDDWWLFQRLSTGDRPDRLELERGESSRSTSAWSAYWSVHESIDRGGEEALEVVVRLLDLAPCDQEVAIVGAGPVNDLVNAHGDALVGSLDELARRRPDFAACLALVAVDEATVEPDTLSRLSRWLPTG